MSWIHVQSKEKSFLSPSQQPYFLFLSPPPPVPSSQSNGFNLNNKVSPSMLLIIIILAIIFFISGLLHLLVRFLLRPPNRDPDESDSVTALQGQLQQLFHLHDAGVDQSFIDTLPVFNYNAIIGVKDPFDCAVCLCEFEADDKLRLLPKCSHAFHMDCIDTWLLSHSTCPICRASLLNEFPPNNNRSPIVLVLESGSESSREISADREATRADSHLSDDLRLPRADSLQKSGEIQASEEDCSNKKVGVGSGGKVVSVKLGKFKNVEGGGGEGSSDVTADARRCFSMGSFAYVMDEKSLLQVPIRTPMKKQSSKKPPGHRLAMSECGGCDSRREFNGFESFKVVEIQSGCNDGGSWIGRDKKESFSVSKIWLRGRNDRPNAAAAAMEPSRRAFSFRFPVQRNGDELKGKNERRSTSEIDMRRWEGSEEEVESCNSLDSQPNHHPSFARRTLLWLMGRPNKVVHSTFSTNV
ncbi:RING/U-box superfamily protein [Perilla frutescens var. hirtella]|nr:RING/U-box superfamily protein [Perilla frutescens var. hirtella]KAH6817458.1 RING/U-box superfamily protein [Perilla frutescens var. frutescens]